MALTLDQFVQRLAESGLISADELAEFQDTYPPEKKPKDVVGLARELVRSKKITKYQAEAVYKGNTKGLVLGEYVVLDEIGRGGMGMVLKARHRRMKRVVALKMLPPDKLDSQDDVDRFYREVEAAARLTHPNIVTAFDASEYNGIHFLAMEYVNGSDLATLVKQSGGLSVEQAVECVMQAAEGLQYAHDQGIVHRDIKPANLLLSKTGTIKILDMGLARLEQEIEEDQERLTSTGQVMGTCDYMAPEQAIDTHGVDHRADIYALGCTFYRLLVGKPPFQGRTHWEVLLGHREAPIPSVREMRPDVPQEVDEVCRKMMAKEPDERYQSMGTVIDALRACVQMKEPALKGAEDSSDSALTSFLVGMAQGGSGTKGQAPSATEETLTHHEQADTLDRVPETPAVVRKLREMRILMGAAAVGVALIVVLASILFLRGRGLGEDDGTVVVDKKTPPPLAIAPFGAEQARKHQEAWAEYLGLPVEWENSIGMKFVLIPPGEFMMGSSEAEQEVSLGDPEVARSQVFVAQISSEAPPHRVKITKPFYLGKYEVTQAEWEVVMGSNPSQFNEPASPVERVSWEDVQLFLTKLNSTGTRRVSSAEPDPVAAGMKHVLPTEAQWEYACRAGTTTAFSFGDDQTALEQYGWFGGNSRKPHPVGQRKPNAWNLYDMHGNVREWCTDWWRQNNYAESPLRDPVGPVAGKYRVCRGGDTYYANPDWCRSARRFFSEPGFRGGSLGFRVVCEIPTDPAELEKFAAAIRGAGAASRPIEPPADEMATLPNGWRVGRPVNLGPVVNSTSNDLSPAISADGLTLFFTSDRPGGPGGEDLWMSTRASTSAPFGEPVNLRPAVNSSDTDGCPALSTDGLTLFFTSDRPGGQGMLDLWESRRTAPDGPFGEPVNLGPIVNSSDSDSYPELSRDGRALYFTSRRPDGKGDADLWISIRPSPSDPFGEPVNVGPPINTSTYDGSTSLSSDGLTVFFRSVRPGDPGGQGGQDLWMSTRAALTEPFDEPVNLGPTVNSSGNESSPRFWAEGRTLFFTSDRPGGQGDNDLWMARIEPPGAAADEVNDTGPPQAVSDTFNLPNGWRFTKPVNLGPAVNSGSRDWYPMLSADGITLFFASDRPGGEGGDDVWMCIRRDTVDPWGRPVNLGATVNTSQDERGLSLSPDALALFSGICDPGLADTGDLYVCERRTAGGDWESRENLGPMVNSDEYADAHPFISADGLTLIFGSNRAGGLGFMDLWICTRSAVGAPWSPPVNLGSTVNSEVGDGSPWLSPDGLSLLFESSRAGGSGKLDLWVCTRRTVSDSWGPPCNLGPTVNTGYDERGPSLSTDGRTLYFCSDRPSGQGGFDIWMCTRVDDN